MKIVELMVQITQTTYGNGADLIWAVIESGCHLVKKFGTAPKQNESFFLSF